MLTVGVLYIHALVDFWISCKLDKAEWTDLTAARLHCICKVLAWCLS